MNGYGHGSQVLQGWRGQDQDEATGFVCQGLLCPWPYNCYVSVGSLYPGPVWAGDSKGHSLTVGAFSWVK